MVWRLLAFAVGATLLLLTGVIGSLSTSAQAGPGDPEGVINSYEMARNRRDVDAALSYFADDATIVQRNTTFTGKDEIRRFLEGSAGRARFVVVSDRHTVGNQVTWTERTGGGFGTAAQAQGLSGFQVTVEAIVQDGKIRSLSYSAFGQAPAEPIVIDTRGQVPAAAGLASVLLLLLGVVALASMGVGRAVGTPSRLRGRLMQDLRGWAAARE
jgi:hypothetical protein